jgi:hypothetical protein
MVHYHPAISSPGNGLLTHRSDAFANNIAPQYHQQSSRKERLSYARKNKKQWLTLDDKAQRISNTINRNSLGIDNNCCCNGVYRFVKERTQLYSMTQDDIFNELHTINLYTNGSLQDEQLLKKVIEHNSFLGSMIRVLPEKMTGCYDQFACNQIKGSTIDQFIDLGEKFSNMTIPNSLKSMIYKGMVHHYVDIFRLYDLTESFRAIRESACVDGQCGFIKFLLSKYNGIYCDTFEGYKESINPQSLQISSCRTYLQATDNAGKIIVWNLQTGEMLTDKVAYIQRTESLWQVTKYWSDYAVSLDINDIRQKRWDYFHKPEDCSQHTLDRCRDSALKNIALGEAILFTFFFGNPIPLFFVSDSNDVHTCDLKEQECRKIKNVVYVYKKPTVESLVALIAYHNSRGSLRELHALRNSKTMQSLTPIMQKHFQTLIDKQPISYQF